MTVSRKSPARRTGYCFEIPTAQAARSGLATEPRSDRIPVLLLVIPTEVMKTITVKADASFDSTLTKLAKRLRTTKSGVIRAAVLNYKNHIEREVLRQRIREASLKTQRQAKQAASDFDSADADGL